MDGDTRAVLKVGGAQKAGRVNDDVADVEMDEGLGHRALLRESERPCGALLPGGSGETSNAGASREVQDGSAKDNNQLEGRPGWRFSSSSRTAWSGEVGASGALGEGRGRRRRWLAPLARRGCHTSRPVHLHAWVARLSQSPLLPRSGPMASQRMLKLSLCWSQSLLDCTQP